MKKKVVIMQMSNLSNKNLRFKMQGNEIIYALFDAFVEITLIRNQAIDFSIAPCIEHTECCKFDSLQNKFTDLLNLVDLQSLYKDNKSLLAQDDIKKWITNKKNLGQGVDDYNLLLAHLHWLWSLGIDMPTTCGGYATDGESFAFTKGGLWSAETASSRKPSDFKFMIDVFKNYFNQQMRPMTIEQAKFELERIVLQLYTSNSTPMANAFLHYCDPNKHIHIFASEVKQKIIEDAVKNKLFISNIDYKTASISDIDAEICRFYDSIERIDTYTAMMEQYFYKNH